MPQRNVATNFTFEQQRQEINLLAADFWTQKGIVDTAASTYLKHDGSNNFTGGTLNVPNAFTISANSGSGTLTISGDLDVTGTTTTVNTANLEVTDKNILIAKGSTSDAQADGAGITIDSATDITFNFVDDDDALVSSIGLEATTHLKAARGQFTGSTSPTTGQGVEINAPDTNTGQIISYDRANTAYKELRVKGSSVGVYAGTTNALVGSFSSTGLSVTGTVTASDDVTITGNKTLKIESSSTDDYVRIYAGGGTGQWDIYGNNADLRFSDNASAGNVVFDRNINANGGLDTTNITASGDINLVNTGTLYGGNTAANVLKLTSTSGNVNHSRIEVGVSEGSDNGGVHIYTAGSTSATRRVTIKGTSGKVGIGTDSPAALLTLNVDTEANLGSGSEGIRLASGSSNGQFVRLGSSYSNNSVTGPGTLIYSSNKLSLRCDNGNPITFHTGSTVAERMRVDEEGRLLVGTSDATSHALSASNNSKIQLESNNANDYARMSLVYNGNDGVGPGFWFGKSRGTELGSNTVINNGDQCGGLFFHAADGTDKYSRVAAIVCYTDGTTGANSTPGKIEFSTTADGAAATTQRMLINKDGHITTPTQFQIEVSRTNDQTGYNALQNFGTPMIFDNVVSTRGTTNSSLNTSTGKVTVPVTGVYFLEASAFTSSGDIWQQAWFTENNSRMLYSDWTANNQAGCNKIQVSGMHKLDAGDEVGFKPYGNSTNVTIGDSVYHTWFRVTLIG